MTQMEKLCTNKLITIYTEKQWKTLEIESM